MLTFIATLSIDIDPHKWLRYISRKSSFVEKICYRYATQWSLRIYCPSAHTCENEMFFVIHFANTHYDRLTDRLDNASYLNTHIYNNRYRPIFI